MNSNNTSGDQTIKPPPVLWAQRADQLLLTIDIEDCKEPTIDLQKDKLHFKGKSDSIQSDANHNEHEVTIEFYKPVKVEESKHVVKARGIEFIIYKEENSWWPRLLKDSTKQHWLKIDFPKWKDEDDSDDEMAAGGPFGASAGGQPDFGNFMQQFSAMGGGGMPGAGGLMGDDEEFDESEDDETEQPLPDLEDAGDDADKAEAK